MFPPCMIPGVRNVVFAELLNGVYADFGAV